MIQTVMGFAVSSTMIPMGMDSDGDEGIADVDGDGLDTLSIPIPMVTASVISKKVMRMVMVMVWGITSIPIQTMMAYWTKMKTSIRMQCAMLAKPICTTQIPMMMDLPMVRKSIPFNGPTQSIPMVAILLMEKRL